MALLEPPEGCLEIPGVIIVINPTKSWLTADGRITRNWEERGVWESAQAAQDFIDYIFGTEE